MPSDQHICIHTLPLFFGRALTGSEGGQSRPDADIPEILLLLDTQNIDWRGFISHRGQLHDLASIITKMRKGEVIHALLACA